MIECCVFWDACYAGDYDTVKYFLERGEDPKPAIYDACASGNRRVAELVIEYGADNDLNGAFFHACYSGSPEVIDLLIEKGVTNWNQGLKGACAGGQLHTAESMIERGATDLQEALNTSVEFDQLELVKMLVERGANDYDKALSRVRWREISLQTVEFLVECGGKYPEGLYSEPIATGLRNLEKVKLIQRFYRGSIIRTRLRQLIRKMRMQIQIECMPGRGIEYLKARDRFES